ncbi:MAG: flagellar basal body rod protein FlgC [Alphaproteobacteria bacterium]
MDPLALTMRVAAAGLEAQSTRMRVVSENIANVNSTGTAPGVEPFRRKTIQFENLLDRRMGVHFVQVKDIGVDKSAFRSVHSPGHPSADENGYVLHPNVNALIEMTDLREASRSYEANLNVIEQARSMLTRTVGLLERS